MIKGDFHVVEYLGWETTYTEIVPFERLRAKSAEPHIGPRTFIRHNIVLPGDIKNCYNDLPAERQIELNKVCFSKGSFTQSSQNQCNFCCLTDFARLFV
jgi:hypothetical protein